MVKCENCEWLVSTPSGTYFCLQQEEINERGENIIIELPITIAEGDDPCNDWEAI